MFPATKKTTALSIAEYFIDKANKENKSITNKKLQKLVYYAQAWSLALEDKKLFDENIEAWIHGPAIKSLYIQYKSFGFNPIIKQIEPATLRSIPSETKELLDNIWSVYGKLDGDYLELLTHSETPWQEAREGLQSSESSENIISEETMKSFYAQKLKDSKQK